MSYLKTTAAIALSLLLLGGTGFAAESTRASLRLDIQSQPLGAALNEFARQSGLQVFLDAQGGKGIIAPRLSGEFTAEAALEQLLAGTSLSYEFINPRTVAVRPRVPAAVSGSAENSLGELSGEQAGRSLVLAQVGDPSPSQGEGQGEDKKQTTDTEPESARRAIPEILVKSSRTLNIDIKRTADDAQPYVVFDREAIEKSGVRDIEEFLRTRLSSQTSALSNSLAVGQGNNASLINLRGLGPEQTLILIDGRRAPPRANQGTGVQADLNGIPLAAIERIEVLSATSSGIYGGGATGGVVNVILRRDYRGLESALTYGSSFDGGESRKRVDMAGSLSLENNRTTLTLVGSFSDDSKLVFGDREVIQDGRARILANNPTSIYNPSLTPILGATTNIRSNAPLVNGVRPNLTLKPIYGGGSVGSPFTHVPYGYQGPSSDNGAAFVSNAGTYNLDPANTAQQIGSGDQSLTSAPKIKSLALTARREFTPWLNAFVDVSGSENEATARSSAVTGTFSLTPAASANPFNESITVRTPAFGTDRDVRNEHRNLHAVTGLIFKFPADWRAEVDYTWGRTRSDATFAYTRVDTSAGTAVSSGAIPTGATFDIFRDTNAFPVDFSPFVVAPTSRTPLRLRYGDVAARFAGPVKLTLPGGAPTFSFMIEHRKETLDDAIALTTTSQQVTYGRWQSVDSAYVEASIPIVSTINGVPGIHLFEVQLAGRRDEYSITGANFVEFPLDVTPDPPTRITRKLSSTDPTFGLRYQPVQDLTIRGSVGTGFLPPAMNQLVPDPSIPGLAGFYTDPKRGGEIIGDYNLLIGGNPNLRPEESKSWSAGFIVQPRVMPGFRLSLDWVRIEKSDNLWSFGDLTQDLVDNEDDIPGLITRGPPSDGYAVGPITEVNGRWLNISRQFVEALDFALDYRLETRFGAVTFSGAATHNILNSFQIISSSPEIVALDTISVLPWQGNLRLDWSKGNWNVGWVTRYMDSYCLLNDCATGSVTDSQGSNRVSSQTFHDLLVGYRFGQGGSSLLADADIRLGITNVFNKKPAVDLSSTPLYSTLGDPRKGSYYVSLTKHFQP